MSVSGTKKRWVASVVVGGLGAGFVIPPRVAKALVCYHAVCVGGGGQGWVCYPAVQDRAGFVIPVSEQGGVCYPAAGAGLGLLSRCCRFGFDRDCVVETGLGCYPAVGSGRVCYPAAGAGLGLLSRCCRFGFDRDCVVEKGLGCYPAVGAGLGLLSRCWSRAGFIIPLL